MPAPDVVEGGNQIQICDGQEATAKTPMVNLYAYSHHAILFVLGSCKLTQFLLNCQLQWREGQAQKHLQDFSGVAACQQLLNPGVCSGISSLTILVYGRFYKQLVSCFQALWHTQAEHEQALLSKTADGLP